MKPRESDRNRDVRARARGFLFGVAVFAPLALRTRAPGPVSTPAAEASPQPAALGTPGV